MPIRAIIVILSIAVALGAAAKRTRTTRSNLKATPEVEATAAFTLDSIAPADGDIALSGFEKTLRSRYESIFVTNNSPVDIKAISLTIEYFDTSGRQLHKRDVKVSCDIPRQQTRQIQFKSWDLQQVWHYRLSQPPQTRYQATPFDISATINYIYY